MEHVFISHSHKDKDVTESICRALKDEGIATWISFRDIYAGAIWDEEIESALDKAASVILIVSPASVDSRYVRAEIERSLAYQKTVIPVIVEDAEMPLRWRSLQAVKWNSSQKKVTIRKIVNGLPMASAVALREALNDPVQLANVKKLILKHFEWLPIEFQMANCYSVKCNVPVAPGSYVDAFAGRLDTGGPRSHLYYLGSPYDCPATKSGKLGPELQAMLKRFYLHHEILRRPMRRSHILAPAKLFQSEIDDWKGKFENYSTIKANFIIGRRKHFVGRVEEVRAQITEFLDRQLRSKYYLEHGGFEMMSYDRILDTIKE